MSKKLILSITLAIYLIILFFAAFAVNISTEASPPGSGKGLHFIGFFILAF